MASKRTFGPLAAFFFLLRRTGRSSSESSSTGRLRRTGRSLAVDPLAAVVFATASTGRRLAALTATSGTRKTFSQAGHLILRPASIGALLRSAFWQWGHVNVDIGFSI